MASAPSEVFQNINISAYRVLFILLMLVRYRSLNMVELNRLLYENPMIGRGYNSETLTKYINTLREVGCRIPRSTNRNDYSYELLRNPFPLALEPKELSVARRLLDVLASQPDEVLYQDYRRLMENLSWAVGCNTSLGMEEETGLIPAAPMRDLGLWRQRYNEFRRYCQEAFALELAYADPERGVQALSVEPYEVLERETGLFLLGLDRGSQEQRLLDLDRIASVRQSPSKNRRSPVLVTVVFALYGRLAKSYRLYPDERLVYSSNTEIHVKTRLAETSGLMLRLLKYGASCQILSPDGLRDVMRQHIEGLLSAMSGKPDLGAII
ncbi:helix-turn-helix transcriptional regulator [Vampirovibrio chlorellavorus]|uniref:helix-turn-helix transcriptional regulator n=1 Tax=Vampirovibrio chlorellavorus TaxID=758823 RepID=UPI0026ECB0A5|nr:WYL domain-containing protein [Vampirovibrio chlorellavorus]